MVRYIRTPRNKPRRYELLIKTFDIGGVYKTDVIYNTMRTKSSFDVQEYVQDYALLDMVRSSKPQTCAMRSLVEIIDLASALTDNNVVDEVELTLDVSVPCLLDAIQHKASICRLVFNARFRETEDGYISEDEQSTLKHLRGAIKTLPNLTYLKLSDITCSSGLILKMVDNAPNLRTIHLSGCNVPGLMDFLNTLMGRVPNIRFDITRRFQPVVFGKALGVNTTLQTLTLETRTKRSAKFLASALKTNTDLRCLKLKGEFSDTCEILSVIANLQNTTLWRLEGVRIENDVDLDILTKFFATNTSVISLSLDILGDMHRQQDRIEAAMRQNKFLISLSIYYRRSTLGTDMRWLKVITDDPVLENFEIYTGNLLPRSSKIASVVDTMIAKNKTLKTVDLTNTNSKLDKMTMTMSEYNSIKPLLAQNSIFESLKIYGSRWTSSRNIHNTIQREVSLVDLLLAKC